MSKMLKVVAVAVAVWLALPAWVDAQPVKGPASAGPGAPTWTPPVMIAGDWVTTQAFKKANVTDDQQAKLKGVLDELAKDAGDSHAKLMADYQTLGKARKAARDAGADPADDPATKAAQDEVTKQTAANAKAFESRRAKVLAALPDVLSLEQIVTVKEEYERVNPDPKIRNKIKAHDWLKFSFPGVTLTADQLKQIEAKAAPIQEKFGQRFADIQKAQGELMQTLAKDDPATAWQTAQKEFAPKVDTARAELGKALNEVVESVLTEDQKKQVAEGRKAAWNKAVVDWADAVIKAFGPVKLTDDQAEKAIKLAAAAGEVMLKTDPYDMAARDKLTRQLREDIIKLLTDEQKAKVQ
jgi:hypothetical protein